MKSSDQLDALSEALVAVQKRLKNPAKSSTAKVQTKTGKDYSYSYAPLDEIVTLARQALVENSLAIVQECVSHDGLVGVATRLVHNSGQWLEYGPLWLPGGNTPQEAGSAITYARRYALCAALGIAAEDDNDAADVKPRPKKSSAGSLPAQEPESADAAVLSSPPTPAGPEDVPTTQGSTAANSGPNGCPPHDFPEPPDGARFRVCRKCLAREKVEVPA